MCPWIKLLPCRLLAEECVNRQCILASVPQNVAQHKCLSMCHFLLGHPPSSWQAVNKKRKKEEKIKENLKDLKLFYSKAHSTSSRLIPPPSAFERKEGKLPKACYGFKSRNLKNLSRFTCFLQARSAKRLIQRLSRTSRWLLQRAQTKRRCLLIPCITCAPCKQRNIRELNGTRQFSPTEMIQNHFSIQADKETSGWWLWRLPLIRDKLKFSEAQQNTKIYTFLLPVSSRFPSWISTKSSQKGGHVSYSKVPIWNVK